MPVYLHDSSNVILRGPSRGTALSCSLDWHSAFEIVGMCSFPTPGLTASAREMAPHSSYVQRTKILCKSGWAAVVYTLKYRHVQASYKCRHFENERLENSYRSELQPALGLITVRRSQEGCVLGTRLTSANERLPSAAKE